MVIRVSLLIYLMNLRFPRIRANINSKDITGLQRWKDEEIPLQGTVTVAAGADVPTAMVKLVLCATRVGSVNNLQTDCVRTMT